MTFIEKHYFFPMLEINFNLEKSSHELVSIITVEILRVVFFKELLNANELAFKVEKEAC